MKVFLQSIFAQLLLNPYICYRGWQALPARKSWRIPFVLCFVIEWLLFFTGFFFHKELPDSCMLPVLFICNTWYIASLYVTLALLVLELLRLSNFWYHWFPVWIIFHWIQVKRVLFLFIFIGTVGLMIHAHQVVMHPKVKEICLTLPKGNCPRDSLTIVMMSDLHIGELVTKPLVQRYVQMSNAVHPDMVVIVGDVMDYELRFAEKGHIEEDLRKLHAALGTYVVYGNHEYRANRFAKQRWLRKTGMTLLVDSVVMPDSAFYLIGRDDYINKRRKSLHALMAGVDTTKPVIVLDHQPVAFPEMRMNHVDLGLHGHTHNGQYWPAPLLLKLVFECPYGYYRKAPTQHYISSGIGIAGAPYRIGTASEMVVLRIRFQSISS